MRRTVKNDYLAAARARRHGMHHALKIAQEARRAGIGYDLAYALVEQETTNARNVFGHDPSIFAGAGRVTARKYREYRVRRRASGNRLMQGVGLTQITWWEYQDQADRLGGCWKPRIQLRWAFRHIKWLIRSLGDAEGIERYNGSGPDAEEYSREVRAKRKKWRKRLNP